MHSVAIAEAVHGGMVVVSVGEEEMGCARSLDGEAGSRAWMAMCLGIHTTGCMACIEGGAHVAAAAGVC